MPTGEKKDGQRGRYTLRHDITRVRKLCRGPQDLSSQISRSKLTWLPDTLLELFFFFLFLCHPPPPQLLLFFGENKRLNMAIDWHGKSQSQRNQSEGARGGSGGYGGGGNAPPPPGYRRPEGPNAAVNSPIEGEEHQAGYNDVYGHVAGNGDGPY